MITVEEVWAGGLPPATALVAGRAGLGRGVTWVTALRARGFPGLKGGELALLSTHALRELEGRPSLPEVLERLSEAGVAAVAVRGDLHPVAPALADQLGLPLLAVPTESDLAEVERQVVRLLVEQRNDLHRRGHELSSQLNELVIDGRSAEDLANRLALLTDRHVALEAAANGRLHLAGPRGEPLDRERVAAALAAGKPAVLEWAGKRPFAPSDPPVARFELGEAGLERLVAPLALGDGLVGLLSVIGAPGRLGETERLAVARGAGACALALARERAVLATEDRLQRDLTEELLADGPVDAAALTARAERLGYDLAAPHLALAVEVGPPTGHPNGHDPRAALGRAAEVLEREVGRPELAVPLHLNETTLAALVPLRPEIDEPAARGLGRRLHETLAGQLRPLVVSVGLAGPDAGIDGLRAASRDARRALALGTRIFGAGGLTHFGDLGLYRLLFRLQHTPEAEEFHREVLGRLEAYDRQNGADLIPTLEAYFAAGASPKETAARLHLHRNTVLYRLQRIAEISGHRLDDPQTSLSLQVALRLRQAASATV